MIRLALLLTLLAAACGSSHTADAGDDSSVALDGSSTDGSTSEDSSSGTDAPTGVDGPPVVPCETFSEAECAGVPYCASHYDDDCCPSCTPGGGCADCRDWAFYECAYREVLCSPAADPCGGALCAPPNCATALPTGRGSCSIAGCIEATPSACAPGGCVVECHAVTPTMCVVACRSLPPPCPSGMRAEGDGMCWTGFCIPSDTCG